MQKLSQHLCAALFLVTTSLAGAQSNPNLSEELSVLEQTAHACYSSLTAGKSASIEQFCSQLFTRLSKSTQDSPQRLHGMTAYAAYLASTKGPNAATDGLQKAVNEFKLNDLESQAELAQASHVLGTIYLSAKKIDLAGKAITKALAITERIGNTTGVIENLILLSDLARMAGDKARARTYAAKTIGLIEKLEPTRLENRDQLLFLAYRAQAQAYESNKQIKEATSSAVKAALYADKAFGDAINPMATGIHAYVARLYLLASDYDHAKPQALAALRSLDEPSAAITQDNVLAMISLLDIYVSTENTPDARAFADKYVEAFEGMPESPYKIKALGSLGSFYMRSTENKALARKLIVTAAVSALKLFGPTSPTAVALSELAESPELDENE